MKSGYLLALRNIVRNRRRSFSTLIALVVGTTSVLLFGGFRTTVQYILHTVYVHEGGHLQIQHRDFFLYGSGNPSEYAIKDYGRIIDAIRHEDTLNAMIAVTTPKIEFGGVASNYDAGVSKTVIGIGLVPGDHARMRTWNEFGLPFSPKPLALEGTDADAAVVGTGVARVLQLCEPLSVADCPTPAAREIADGEELPADISELAMSEGKAVAVGTSSSSTPTIQLLASSPRGAPNVVSVKVVRAERQGFKELDDVYTLMHLPKAQQLIYGRSDPRVTSILVQLHRSSDIPDARLRLEHAIKSIGLDQPITIVDFRQVYPFFQQTIRMFDAIFGFIFVLIGTIVLFTVSNTMNTIVMERTVEIGTLRAIGLRRRSIQRLFMLEGTLLGVFGAVSGAVIALMLSWVINKLNLTWLPPGSSDPLPLLLVVWGEVSMIAGTTLALIMIAAISAWWPARRASRMVIVEALRHT